MYMYFSYLANLCWDGGCVNFIILRRVKQKAPSPPCDVSAGVGILEDEQHNGDVSKCCDTLESRRPSSEFGSDSGASIAQDNRRDLNCCGGRTDCGNRGGTMPARVHSQVVKSHNDSFSRESARQVRRHGVTFKLKRFCSHYIHSEYDKIPFRRKLNFYSFSSITYIWPAVCWVFFFHLFFITLFFCSPET